MDVNVQLVEVRDDVCVPLSVRLPGASSAIRKVAMSRDHFLLLTNDDTAVVVDRSNSAEKSGENSEPQIGIGREIKVSSSILQVCCGLNFSSILLSDRSVVVWGHIEGVLATPGPVILPCREPVISLAAGRDCLLAISKTLVNPFLKHFLIHFELCLKQYSFVP